MTTGRFVSEHLPNLAQPGDFGVLDEGRPCVGLRFDTIEVFCTHDEYANPAFREWFYRAPMTRVNDARRPSVTIHIR